ncbi:hypothetical protein [Enterovirga sp. CN4-39]|uniref:hypothetical protein n=1 Tax=Enterovirga sp. CN4-39 TaxID=3400910 RepID=UPI003C10A5BB
MRRNTWVVRTTGSGFEFSGGDKVESGPGFIAEGAWSDRFSADGLLDARFVCGSGVVFGTDRLSVVAPSHCLESVYCFRSGQNYTISNSVHALIAAAPDAAPPSVDALRKASSSAKQGTKDYLRLLYETASGQVYRYHFGGFDLDLPTGALSERPRPTIPTPFTTFEAYRSTLLTVLNQLASNARSSDRKSPYANVITTCSAGYDSAACAALAKGLGADTAVTLRVGRKNLDDSGLAVAEALGLRCYEYDRPGSGHERRVADRNESVLDSALLGDEYDIFMAALGLPEGLFFATFTPHLSDAIVLTGFHGDKAWALGCPSGPEIRRGDNSGSGLDEFRKGLGFVNVPVPFIGIEQNEAIAQLGASDEMKPYRIGGTYDRPIPRRIAEEAGVPREAFGFRKAAGSVLLENSGRRRKTAFADLVSEYRGTLEFRAL